MIEFVSVGKTYRDGTAAVQDLSLIVPSGQITVIVGPSGCGKTTTLRMVNRMLEPSTGTITWDGTPLKSRRKTTLRRQMGYVIQNGGLFPHRSVLDNIGTVPGLLGWSKQKIRDRSLTLLDNVGLDRRMANRFPAQLSGGQQQRVGVARALAADPLVMLMDEPFSAVDPVVRAELHEFFLGLQREISKTIILITHDIDEAIKLGDQVVILRVGGQLAQVGTPQQLLDEPTDAFVEGFIGRDRGYRSLSFRPAGGISLDSVRVVRDLGSAAPDEPTLVVDADARPIGWAGRSGDQRMLPLGSTFVPDQDTLRVALDSALTSPYGLAVAVAPDTGRFAGVVGASAILAQVSRSKLGAEPATITVSPTSTAGASSASTAGASSASAAGTAATDDGSGDRAGSPTTVEASGSGSTRIPVEPPQSGADQETVVSKPAAISDRPPSDDAAAAETAGTDDALDESERGDQAPIVVAGVPVAENPAETQDPRPADDDETQIRPTATDRLPGDDDAPTEIRPYPQAGR